MDTAMNKKAALTAWPKLLLFRGARLRLRKSNLVFVTQRLFKKLCSYAKSVGILRELKNSDECVMKKRKTKFTEYFTIWRKDGTRSRRRRGPGASGLHSKG